MGPRLLAACATSSLPSIKSHVGLGPSQSLGSLYLSDLCFDATYCLAVLSIFCYDKRDVPTACPSASRAANTFATQVRHLQFGSPCMIGMLRMIWIRRALLSILAIKIRAIKFRDCFTFVRGMDSKTQFPVKSFLTW